MEIDKYGRVTVSESEAIRALYSGKIHDLADVYLDDPTAIKRFNDAAKNNADGFPLLKQLPELNISVDEFDRVNQEQWLMPKDYCPDLIDIIYDLCTTEQQRKRVDRELELFVKHGMTDLLYYLKYLVDTFRKEGIVWGVGRGSSVASYVLFLIGVHKIDSIKYELDITEFLK